MRAAPAILAFFATAAMAAQNASPVRTEQVRIGTADRDKQEALRRVLQTEFERRLLYSQDVTVSDYVRALSTKVAPGSVTHVVASSDVFAAAIPPNHIYLTTGLLARVQNETELAGVVAHEGSHLARPSAPGPVVGPPASPSSAKVEWRSAEGGICLRFGGMAFPMTAERERESMADRYAAPVLREAGYSPVSMLDFFESLRPALAYLGAERIELAASEPAESVLTTSAFETMQSRVRRPPPRWNF